MRIGIDLGGTKIEGIALSHAGEVLFRDRVPTPAGDYDATVRAVAELVARIEREAWPPALPVDRGSPVRPSVGIGTPGSPSPATGLMRNANSTCLNGRPLD